MSITRRDFLNGAALTIASGLTPEAQLAAAARAKTSRYPPALTGLRGSHAGSFETAHALAREGRLFPVESAPIDERYDLVVVGGGISGLSAAWFYRRARPTSRILILDNHDDFGGPRQAQRIHAERPAHHRLRRQPIAAIAADALESDREGAAARSQRRHRAFRHGVRAHALSQAWAVPGFVLQSRSVRPRRAGGGRGAARERG